MDAISGPLADIVKSKVFHRIYLGKLKNYEGNAYKTAKFQILRSSISASSIATVANLMIRSVTSTRPGPEMRTL